MAVSGRGRAETCVNHPDQAAATRCAACHKPVCAECIVSSTDGKFCSQQCARRTADFRKHNASAGKKAGRSVMSLVKTVVGLGILVVVVYFGYRILVKKEKPADLLPSKDQIRELGDRVKDKAAELKDKAGEKAGEAEEAGESAESADE